MKHGRLILLEEIVKTGDLLAGYRCTARCYRAPYFRPPCGSPCVCACGGANHGRYGHQLKRTKYTTCPRCLGTGQYAAGSFLGTCYRCVGLGRARVRYRRAKR